MAVSAKHEPSVTNGDGVTTAFPINYVFESAADIQVYIVDLATGIERRLASPADYSIAGDAVSGYRVETVTAPVAVTGGGTAGEKLVHFLSHPGTQPQSYKDLIKLPSVNIELMGDRAARANRAIGILAERALRLPVTETGALVLPILEKIKGKALAFDPVTGQPKMIATTDLEALGALTAEIEALSESAVLADMAALAESAVLADMSALADRTTELDALGARTAEIDSIYANIANVIAVAADLLGDNDIGTCADNIAAIIAAPSEAAAAAASASAAAASATLAQTRADAVERTRHDDAVALRAYYALGSYGAISSLPHAIIDGGTASGAAPKYYIWAPFAAGADDGDAIIQPTGQTTGRFVLRGKLLSNSEVAALPGGVHIANFLAAGRGATAYDTMGYEVRLSAAAGVTPALLVDRAGTPIISTNADDELVCEKGINGRRVQLTGNRTYYVNHATGLNSNDGLTSGTAFATISYAWEHIRDRVDLKGYNVIIQVASATFDEVIIISGMPVGYRDLGSIIIRGDTTTPNNCFNSHAGQYACLSVYDGAFARVEGIKFANAGAADHCVKVYRGAYLEIGQIAFGSCAKSCLQSASGWIVTATRGTVSGNVTFDNTTAQFGVVCEVGDGGVDLSNATITFTGTVSFSGASASAFINAGEGTYCALYSVTWSGTFAGRNYYISDAASVNPQSELESIPGTIEGVWKSPIISAPQGRLTLTNGTPVTASDVTAATTIYYEPYTGEYGVFSVNGSTAFEMVTIGAAGLSLALDGNSGHTGYHQAGKNFDVFLIRVGNDFNLATGPAWTNDTTRAAAVSFANSIWSNTASMTARYGTGADDTTTVAAGSGVYVGTFRTSADGQTEDSLANRLVWNMYNRRPRPMRVTEATDSWTYQTYAWRAANGSTANRLTMVRGFDEDEVAAEVCANAKSDTAGADIGCGIGLDSTAARATGVIGGYIDAHVAGYRDQLECKWRGLPGLGYHFLQWIEIGEGGGPTNTFEGDSGAPTAVQSGIQASVMA